MAHNKTKNITKINQIPIRTSKSLFLDEKSADFHFSIISNDEQVFVPAHKVILAKGSPVFESMLYGGFKKENEVPITDATVGEFKEFLQFFYVHEPTLTLENVAKVMELADRYILIECLDICEDFLRQHTELHEICSVYQLSITYNRSRLKDFCEQKISKNSMNVFDTSHFRECSVEVLKNILQLDSFSCEAKEVFDACMDWAKYSCERNGMDSTKAENLKKQLGDCLHFIEFELMTHKQFSQCITRHKGLFHQDELEEIIAIMSNEPTELKKFKRKSLRRWDHNLILECSRFDSTQGTRHINQVEIVTFRINQRVLLGEIGIPFLDHSNNRMIGIQCLSRLEGTMTILEITSNDNGIIDQKMLLKQSIRIDLSAPKQTDTTLPQTRIKLVKPVVCDPNELYEVQFIFNPSWSYQSIRLHGNSKSEVTFGLGFKIIFDTEKYSFLSHLYFNFLNLKFVEN